MRQGHRLRDCHFRALAGQSPHFLGQLAVCRQKLRQLFNRILEFVHPVALYLPPPRTAAGLGVFGGAGVELQTCEFVVGGGLASFEGLPEAARVQVFEAFQFSAGGLEALAGLSTEGRLACVSKLGQRSCEKSIKGAQFLGRKPDDLFPSAQNFAFLPLSLFLPRPIVLPAVPAVEESQVAFCVFVGAVVGLHEGDDCFVVVVHGCVRGVSKHIIESEYKNDRTIFIIYFEGGSLPASILRAISIRRRAFLLCGFDYNSSHN